MQRNVVGFVNNNRIKQPKMVRLYISSPYRHGVICFFIKIEIREKTVNTMPKALQILIIFAGSLTENRKTTLCGSGPTSSMIDRYFSIKLYL